MIPEYVRPRNSAVPESLTPVVGDGSNVFDPEENRNDVFAETVKTRNTITHVPYRGNEQHGVEFNTPAEDFQPYESEQRAFERDVDPTVTPRDLVPQKPVPVQIVDRPDMLNRRNMFMSNMLLQQSDAYVQLVQPNIFRKRLLIQSSTLTGTPAASQFYLCADDVAPDDNRAMVFRVASSAVVLLDTAATCGFWIKCALGGTYISVVQEYIDYEGQPIL